MNLSLPAYYNNVTNLWLGKLWNLNLLHHFSFQNPELFILFSHKNNFTGFQPYIQQWTGSRKETGKICGFVAQQWLETWVKGCSLHSSAYFAFNTMHNCVFTYSASTAAYLCQGAEVEISHFFATFPLLHCSSGQSPSQWIVYGPFTVIAYDKQGIAAVHCSFSFQKD